MSNSKLARLLRVIEVTLGVEAPDADIGMIGIGTVGSRSATSPPSESYRSHA